MLTVFGPILETVLPKAMTITKAPTFAGAFVMVNYVKSKLNAICTELHEVYSFMRVITVAGYIPA